jgi:squalene cyclase
MFPLFLVMASGGLGGQAAPPGSGPEERALAYLAREVPRWSKKKNCYSCHHNGDAARALIAAVRLRRSVPRAALADTLRWLEQPGRWDHNGGEGPFSDKKLARLQFAATLAAAHKAGLVKDRRALEQAGRLVAAEQAPDGSWRVGLEEPVGSPATHGTALATHLARGTLQRVDARRYRDRIARADAWLRKAPVDKVLDAAAVLLALGKANDPAAQAQKKRCLAQIRKGESRSGGWGPYMKSPSEVFDTALVLLALAQQPQKAEVKTWMKRGRAFLLAEQEKDGGWPETTRPSGGTSHAQRLATTGWATLALLASGRAT